MGNYQEIHSFNRYKTENYNHRVYSFVRWSEDEKLIIVSNFDTNDSYEFELKIPENVISSWKLDDGNYTFKDQLYGNISTTLKVEKGFGSIKLKINPLESLILKL